MVLILTTDYSLMNTAKQLLWLPTTRNEKHKAKQAVDNLFVRLGDLFAALDASGFALVHLGFVLVWLGLAWLLVRHNQRLTGSKSEKSSGCQNLPAISASSLLRLDQCSWCHPAARNPEPGYFACSLYPMGLPDSW